MSVTIAAVNALPYADEIKELFLAHARPEFPDYFDRAYPRAFADAATSWLGRDPGGRLVMHIACFPQRFTFGARQVVAGLLANLMVATAYRTFFPALQLIQRLIQDSKARGDIDFLYADPNEESRTLLRGTRFAQIGTLRRYVLPVCDRRPYLDLGIRLFHALLRVSTRARRLRHGGADPSLTPQHDEALYATRLKGYPGSRDWWFTWQGNGAAGPPDAVALVRGPDPSGMAALHVVRWASGFAPWSFLPDLIPELRRRGCERLQIMTLAESRLGRMLRRAGFIPRSDEIPLFAYALTPLGDECVRAVKDWEITDLDCDR